MEQRTINMQAITTIRQRVDSSDVCMIITTDADGNRHNRPMAAVKFDDEGCCWFFASKSSGKLKDISGNNKIQVVFSDSTNEDYMEIHGTGAVVCDEHEIASKWSPLVSEWFPSGVKDPAVCLVRIEITSVFYWDAELEAIKRLSISSNIEVKEDRLAA